jgi:putative oxygen-independent coproporphyrinogen III oxidase
MPSGLYVHVPFCATRCGYCSFYAETDGDRPAYLRALLLELERELPSEERVDSIFVGGGTPSWLPPVELEGLLAALAPRLTPGGEFSLECNPEDLDAALLSRLTAGGVTRLSLGIQALDDTVLARAGRRHDAAGARRALELAAASDLDFSADLIIGLPGQTAESYRSGLEELLAFEPDHVSIYSLELEDDAPMRRVLERSPGLDPGDGFRADRYLESHERMAAAGLLAYEVSNWSRPGAECRHNLAIWRGGEFLGLGPAAHSRHGGRRWSNCADLNRWQEALLDGKSPPREEDSPDEAARHLEHLLLGLRIREGLPLDDPALTSHSAFAADCERAGWADRESGRWRLTPTGWLRLDGILARLAS